MPARLAAAPCALRQSAARARHAARPSTEWAGVAHTLTPCAALTWPAQLYMNQREVVAILHQHAKVEPDFTVLVWEKLEEQNSEFFNAYHTRLRLKDQILAFNSLLEQQAVLAQKLRQQEGHFRAASAPPHLMQSPGIHPGGAAKLSSSGLMLDRTGAFLSAGDFLMEHGHGHPHAHPLAGPSPLPAVGDGLAGGGGAMLSHLPRSFSLSDLSVEMSAQIAGDGDVHMALLSSMHMPGGGEHGAGELREGGKLPHTFSLSDIRSLLGGI